MQDNAAPVLPGMPAPQRICGVPGCETKLNRDNSIGLCRDHRSARSRTGTRICSLDGCERELHYKTVSGFCSVHAPRHTPAFLAREADRLAEKAERDSQRQTCTADGCTKLLNFDNKSGRCYTHKWIPVSADDRSKCPIEGCGRRLSPKNTLGRCENTLSRAGWLHIAPPKAARRC